MSTQRVLIVGPNWVGDMVIAQGLFKDLKRRDPETIIDVVAPPWSMPLLWRMPEVHQAISLPVKHGELALLRRYRLGRQLRWQGYTRSIVLPNSFKSALLPWFLGVPRRSGYLGEMRHGLLNEIHIIDQLRVPLLVQRYVALGYPPGKLPSHIEISRPRLRVDEQGRDDVTQRLQLTVDGRVIVFAPGAQYGPAKQWPGQYFADLAARLCKQGVQVWLMGSQQDVQICRDIARRAGKGVTDLCDRTSLQEAMDLMSLASAVVTNDSGLMHIAAALQLPIVAIFGSSTPDYTPPLSPETSTRILHLGLSCSPCFKRECPLGHSHCLTKIDVERVHEAVMELI
jgi:heptosyltransferase-2